MGDPHVSVITPVYNGEEHLRECIESVLSQTYTNWDYTIVNNCSTDGTLDIAREYADKDPRIRIHNNKAFIPVIENHNNALRQIAPESKYCKPVFADDWLYPECIEKMVALAEAHPRVVLVCAYALQGTKVVYDDVIPDHRSVIPGRDACRWRLLGGKYIFGAASAVLYPTDILRSRPAFYNEANLHADSEINFELLEHRDLGFVHQVLGFRREREESLTSYSTRFNTYAACRLFELVTYGPRYLTAAELDRRLRENLWSYYRYLATQVYERREPKFWKFHCDRLAEVGHPLSRARLIGHVALYTLDLLLNPKLTTERAGRRLRRLLSSTLGRA
jgi:glycosyltransferase involved in cell wall biosynthesis